MKKVIALMLIIVSLFVCVSCNNKKPADPDISDVPTLNVTTMPTEDPTSDPTSEATEDPTLNPTGEVTEDPTLNPTGEATDEPTEETTEVPTEEKTEIVTIAPTDVPTKEATKKPTATPTAKPTPAPTAKTTPKSTPKATQEPVIPSGGDYTRSGNYIYFGSYPASQVNDETLKAKLAEAAGSTSSWTSYKYYFEGVVSDFMKYKDVTYNGQKYRGVFFTSYRPYYTRSKTATYGAQKDNGYKTNTIYWFKFEPIKWRILEEKNGDAFLLSETILDSQEFHMKSNNYAESSIRAWLNSTFLNTAFTASQLKLIKTTKVDNSASSTGDPENMYACDNTNDKVFLLSYKEATNKAYGFSSTYYDDAMRAKSTTSYAKAQGISFDFGAGWWLRSPDYTNSHYVRFVKTDGYINDYCDFTTDYTSIGVVPALHITL